MNPIGQAERATQNLVIALFRDEFGHRHLGGPNSSFADQPGRSRRIFAPCYPLCYPPRVSSLLFS